MTGGRDGGRGRRWARRLGAVASGAGLVVCLEILCVLAGWGDRESDLDFVSIQVLEGEGNDVVVGPPDTNACGERTPPV